MQVGTVLNIAYPDAGTSSRVNDIVDQGLVGVKAGKSARREKKSWLELGSFLDIPCPPKAPSQLVVLLTFQRLHGQLLSIRCDSGSGGAGTVSDRPETGCTGGVAQHHPWGRHLSQGDRADRIKYPGQRYLHKRRRAWRRASRHGSPRRRPLLEGGFR